MWKVRKILAGRGFSDRNSIMIGALLVLLILNILRWIPGSIDEDRSWSGAGTNEAAEELLGYLNYVKPETKQLEVRRDLFSPVVSPTKITRPVIEKTVVKVEEPKQPRISNLDGYKLEGVIDGEGRIQAFISKQDEIYMVYKGDKLSGAVVVDTIKHDGVLIKDAVSGESRLVELKSE